MIGEEELSELDKRYLLFGDKFERDFLAQGERENRSIEQTLELGWKILAALPRAELYRIKEQTLEKYFTKYEGPAAGDQKALGSG